MTSTTEEEQVVKTSASSTDISDDQEAEHDYYYDYTSAATAPVLNVFERCLHFIFFLFVEIFAQLLAAILSHPIVLDASAQIVVEGMNKFGEQPDLSDRLSSMLDAVLNEEQKKKTARQAGEDVPLYVSGFVGGLISKITKKPDNNNNNKELVEQRKKEKSERRLLAEKKKKEKQERRRSSRMEEKDNMDADSETKPEEPTDSGTPDLVAALDSTSLLVPLPELDEDGDGSWKDDDDPTSPSQNIREALSVERPESPNPLQKLMMAWGQAQRSMRNNNNKNKKDNSSSDDNDDDDEDDEDKTPKEENDERPIDEEEIAPSFEDEDQAPPSSDEIENKKDV